tara:strand:- start:450 stop:614 length:165 start_codon:yes stop_codon:yes gene_type:complete
MMSGLLDLGAGGRVQIAALIMVASLNSGISIGDLAADAKQRSRQGVPGAVGSTG